MTSTRPAIETHELTKRYAEDVTAIEDLELTVDEGEVYGFLGPNGAGKSTTIEILVGVERPTAGSATVLGRDVEEDSLAIRRSTGLLPGEFGLFDHLTGREHVRFALDCKDASSDPAALLDRVGRADAPDQRTDGFSTGMKRRLALAMALAGDPDLLVLDEPTRGLDPNGARMVRDVVREEVDRGATVFFSSHSMAQVEAVCDRVGVLRNGRLIAEGEVDMLTDRLDDHRLVVTVDAIPDGLVDQLEHVEAVSDVRTDDLDVVVSLARADRKATVVDVVESSGATILDIDSRTPSLEDFFATVTADRPPAESATADGGDPDAGLPGDEA